VAMFCSAVIPDGFEISLFHSPDVETLDHAGDLGKRRKTAYLVKLIFYDSINMDA